ncbi:MULTISPECIES: GAF and ANTAR domain-containing protein [Mycolicibacterium]|uniref:Histidine kinase n=1 Tax=Mycolicibacterium wolinskyi TaxID=59750 RepID=A0A1X2ES35_9MYCO|nr:MULTISPECIES: GAF and ANTAR domain-containing protein [Mycolicibacterium]MCV7290259.1 GAF and ANTAR domain-containing protein [Mycolicibacterium wolinskyi]MCV7297632.1 GAF and ANTAR domain-containing protein [Mycolicibacterium goodii]ORX08886.1 histidine kinase [Mycolicibacterium wolinskyi]
MTSASNHDLAVRMAELARDVAAPAALEDVLRTTTKAVLDLVPGAQYAGMLLLGTGGKYETLAPTSDLMYELDHIQISTGEGPCVQAAVGDLIVRTDDFEHEQRWPVYTPKVLELGVRSSLSFMLYTTRRNAGALNMFSSEPHAFDAESEAIGSVLAAHAAAAIVAGRHGEQLQTALSSRDLIGQAKGMIMERYNVDAVRAFEMLRQLSQSSNVKLVDVAKQVIETRSGS